MFAPCCEAEGVHVTLMYHSWLVLSVVTADLIRPGGEMVRMSELLHV